jgi:hypothetical protein
MFLNKNWEEEIYEFMEEIVLSVSFRQVSNINHDKTYTPPQMNRVVNSRESDFKNQIMKKKKKEINHRDRSCW